MKLVLIVFLAVLALIHVFIFSLRTQAQGSNQRQARLIKRYEYGTSQYRIVEDALEIRLEPEAKNREVVAIRVCSREALPLAMFHTAIDPFETAEYLRDYYAYAPDKIFFLRSEDCLSSNDSKTEAAEIWIASQGEALPQSVESYRFDQIRRTLLGTEPTNRGIRDYQSALQCLIKRMHNNANSLGVILGYYLEHPNPLLQQRMRDLENALKQSGFPHGRYRTVLRQWYKGDSNYPDSEPQYPNLILVEIVKRNTVAIDHARK